MKGLNLGNIKLFLLDLVYPNRCPCCNKFIAWNELVCEDCVDKLEVAEYCNRCGKSPCICKKNPCYDNAICLFKYEGLAREGILSLKDGNNKNFAIYSGQILAEKFSLDENEDYLITAIPSTKKKIATRGFNQAEIISDTIAKKLGIAKDYTLLRKTSEVTQHKLTHKERMLNKNFSITEKELSGKHILICDDVLTTASTVNYCSELLKKNGAERVTVMVCTTV